MIFRICLSLVIQCPQVHKSIRCSKDVSSTNMIVSPQRQDASDVDTENIDALMIISGQEKPETDFVGKFQVPFYQHLDLRMSRFSLIWPSCHMQNRFRED